MSGPDTVVQLGDFSFVATEVPEVIPFGGEQLLDVKQLQGGVRIVDAMGPSDRPLEWSGRFRGQSALQRARYLDTLRKAGQPLSLTWSELSYTVVIRAFDANFERVYEIPYHIVCEVVEDLSAPVDEVAEPGLDDALGDDMGAATGLGGLIGDGGLIGEISALGSALGAVQDIFNAATSDLNSILDPLASALGAVAGLITTGEAVAASVTTLGGAVTGPTALSNPAMLLQQAQNAETLARCYELQSTLGRMQSNLAIAGISGQLITTAGGTLQQLAADAYGDPTQWTAIARANDLTDPVITGVVDLRIPPVRDKAGGVLRRA
jgi:hypothetical protein